MFLLNHKKGYPMTIRYEEVMVTPTMARQWLALNVENNRLPKKSKIPVYARDMMVGRWLMTGEAIKFDEGGMLIDGQNRLHAVVLADVAVLFTVAYDVPRASMVAMDAGTPRGAADALAIAGARAKFRSAAVVRWALMWDAGNFTGSGGKYAPSVSETMDRYLAESGAFDAATARGNDVQRTGLGAGAPAGVAFYLFAQLDTEQAHTFFDLLITGANMNIGHPVLTLRNKLARLRVDRLTRAEQFAAHIRAWNGVRAGETMARIVLSNNGQLTNSNFPMPK